MAIALSLNCHKPFLTAAHPKNSTLNLHKSLPYRRTSYFTSIKAPSGVQLFPILNQLNKDSAGNTPPDNEVDNLGVKAALSVLRFYKREISPLLPKSCRYIPTCSEYSMQAYKKYGVVKGTILTTWRICRCNPFGGSGFDPPRWFNEASPPKQ